MLKRTVKHILITTDARDDAAAQKTCKKKFMRKFRVVFRFAQAASQFSEDPSSKQKVV